MTRSTLVFQRFLAFTLEHLGHKVAQMPRAKALRLGTRLGRLSFWLVKRPRTTSLRNLRLIYGDALTQAQRQELTQKVFEHFGRVTLDFYRSALRGDDNILELVTEIEGWENEASATGAGKGVIGVSGHLGNFEIFARYAAKRGVPLTVVARDPSDPVFGTLVKKIRLRGGYDVVSKGGASVRKLFVALKKGEAIGLLPDQNSGDTFIPFLGVPAGTTTGPAALSLKTGAPIVPSFCVMKPDTTYKIVVQEPLWPQEGESETSLMARVNLALEEGIRQYPEQYLWLHNRWKSAFEEKNAPRWPTGYDLPTLKALWHG
ncbi:lysophospholipid acyltransferase family protein [Armatimonas sp.]|uniref:lysophospholipid acyltransferase family protein n=1 Tax=Armatimonas sp. TaxID=1872638 RepID=UPI003752600B